MFIIRKIIANFIISPALPIILILVFSCTIKKFTSKSTKKIILISSIFLYIISIRPTKEFLARGIEPKSIPTIAELTSTGAYVLLGGGITEGTPLGDIPTNPAYSRIFNTAKLYNIKKKPILITGGRVYGRSLNSESRVYKDCLISLGVDKEDIIIEEKSRDTFENAFFSKKILDGLNRSSITLITSASHMKRSNFIFKHTGLKVIEYPSGYSMNNSRYKFIDFIPSSSNLYHSYKLLWEYFGIIFYRVKVLLA